MSRLRFLLLFPVLAAYGFFVEPGRLRVRTTDEALANWPRPMRIVLIADIHAGAPFVDLDKLDTIADEVNAVEPDLVLLLGDYMVDNVVGGDRVMPEVTAEILGGIHAPTYAVLGNHDRWFDADRVEDAFEVQGIHVMRNEAVDLGGVTLIGLDDGREDVSLLRTITGPTLVAVHNPDIAQELPKPATLLVAGHTHGGQVALPWLGGLIQPTINRYRDGDSTVEGQHVFVTPGIGTSILPIRIGVPPTIDVLEVR